MPDRFSMPNSSVRYISTDTGSLIFYVGDKVIDLGEIESVEEFDVSELFVRSSRNGVTETKRVTVAFNVRGFTEVITPDNYSETDDDSDNDIETVCSESDLRFRDMIGRLGQGRKIDDRLVD
jgi:hypothetical protein